MITLLWLLVSLIVVLFIGLLGCAVRNSGRISDDERSGAIEGALPTRWDEV